ncbi:hypothetical protein PPYR_02836 [Photinus pyralis]|uniref:Protein kinase domain-containing protein n=2 Tax=Photinus pyralis TaxID=7054 RepID=A0A5N4A158_PHOPY|nr:serine/threonine-protein kinase 33-like isoform X1 [Photinus pyralis]KAB0791036.1 hypothetical protein PPYR_02836 [Photinus pyralis]
MSKSFKRIRSFATNTTSNWNSSIKDTGKLKERDIYHVRLSDSSDLRSTYSFGEQIGRGGFGTVINVVDRQSEKEWALKIVCKAAVKEKIDTVYREIRILKMVNHPHIIYLDKVYESAKKIYLVLELCRGTLSTIYKEQKPFSESNARKIIRDLTSAVSYLHKHDIVHRDLKLENILIAKNPEDVDDELFIKITDFGLSIVKQGSGYENMLHDLCGTFVYMAPEIITMHSYSQQCDVWAIGIIMYMLLMGDLPFYSPDERVLTDMICESQPSYNNFPGSTEALDLLTKLLNKNPALRSTAVEVTQHPWIVGEEINEAKEPENVLDMMRLWRSDMMLPIGDECDWVSEAKAIRELSPKNAGGNKQKVRDSVGMASSSAVASPANTLTRKQSMHLPVKNIRFDKAGGKRQQQEATEARRGTTNTPSRNQPMNDLQHGANLEVFKGNKNSK